jgi:hypothetical protein
MSEPKAYASLSSGLLARKGGAKPAMRPQGFTNFGGNIEDLGWNDMGGEVESYDHVPSSIAALTPAPNGRAPLDLGPATEPAPESDEAFTLEPPVVVEQQRALEESFAPAEIEPEPPVQAFEQVEAFEEKVEAELPAPVPAAKPSAPVVRLPKRRAIPAAVASTGKAKAAFTLRLDPDRHLRLRLACAVTGKSAQQLVTAALDDFLSTLPEVEELAGRVPAGQRSR